MHRSPHLIGKKLVCVDDTFHPQVVEFFDRIPRKNQIYTVAEVLWLFQHNTRERTLAVRLTELPPLRAGSPRCGFSLWHFRLLEDTTSSASRHTREAQYCS